MASFTLAGLDQIMLRMQSQGKVDEIVPDMLIAGAKVLIPYQKAEAERVAMGDDSIGTMARSIGATNVRKTKSGGLAIQVYPQGEQPHGNPFKKKGGMVSNASVGFMLEYGTSKMASRPWISVARIKAEQAVIDAMTKVYLEWEAKQDA